ncbi:Uncharacterised protein [uncultured archaeon]|nr:Uncharacterised protein [uncultured archaeon]
MDNGFLENWKQVNELTINFLKCIPEDDFEKKPFDNKFKNFAWEFGCILSTREGYIRGWKGGTLDGSMFSGDLLFSKAEFLKKLNSTGDEILKILEDKGVKEINYFGSMTSKEVVLSWLLQHEHLHYGKLVLYLSNLGIPLPESLVRMWGSSFKKS